MFFAKFGKTYFYYLLTVSNCAFVYVGWLALSPLGLPLNEINITWWTTMSWSKQIPGGVTLRFLAFCPSAFALDVDCFLAPWVFNFCNSSKKKINHVWK